MDTQGTYHGDSDLQLERIGVYYKEVGGRYIPRAIFTDMDPVMGPFLQGYPFGDLIQHQNRVFGQSEHDNYNWARGHYSENSALLAARVLEAVRREAESCDSLQGFQMTHGLYGGTGGGFGTRLLSHLHDDYPGCVVSTFSVASPPEHMHHDAPQQPYYYNGALSLHQMTENANLCFMMDNKGPDKIHHSKLSLTMPRFCANHYLSAAMVSATCCLRLPCTTNYDLHKLAGALVPFPRSHFLLFGVTPLSHLRELRQQEDWGLSPQERAQQPFDAQHTMCDVDPRLGRYLSCLYTHRGYRGQAALKEAEEEEEATRAIAASDWFVQDIQGKVHTTACPIPPRRIRCSRGLVANSTAIQQLWMKMADDFAGLFRTKAFLHKYLAEGMEEFEFAEAENNIRDLIANCQQLEAAPAPGDAQVTQQVEGAAGKAGCG